MTRNDFIEGVNEWWELIDFCYDEECDICEDIVSGDDLSRRIEEDISEALSDGMDWREIRDRLGNIDTGYDYYVTDGYMIYEYLTNDDFESYKSSVLEWVDNYGDWDEEPDDEYIEEEDVPVHEPEAQDEEDEPIPQEEFHVTELISMCVVDVRALQEADRKRQEEESVRVSEDMDFLFPF